MLEKDGPLICIKKPKRGHGREPGRLLRSQQREQWAQHVETRDAAVLGGTEMEARAAGVAYNRLFIVAWTPHGSRFSPPTKFSGPSREKNTGTPDKDTSHERSPPTSIGFGSGKQCWAERKMAAPTPRLL